MLLLKSPLEIVEIIQARIKGPACTDALIAIASEGEDSDALIAIVGDENDDSCCDSHDSNDENIVGGGGGGGNGGDGGREEKPARFDDAAPATLPTGVEAVLASPQRPHGVQVTSAAGSVCSSASADFISLSWLEGVHEGDTILPVAVAPALVGAATLASTPSAQTRDLTYMLQADPAPLIPNRHFYGMPPLYRWLVDYHDSGAQPPPPQAPRSAQIGSESQPSF